MFAADERPTFCGIVDVLKRDVRRMFGGSMEVSPNGKQA